MLDELAAFLTLYVKSYQAAPGVVGDVDMSHDVLMVRRLLITKVFDASRRGPVHQVRLLQHPGRHPGST